jgi:hypothetical protein
MNPYAFDSCCFLKPGILKKEPKGKLKLWKLVNCQLSLFSGDLKPEKREQ